MMRWPMVCVAGLLCYGLGGCGDDSANAGDSQGGTQAASSQSTGTSSSSPSDDWRSWDPPTCEAGMMPVFNQTTCQSVGDPCPDGAWPSADGAAEPVLYVAPGGGGDGTSSEAPLGSLTEGLARVGGAGTLLVAKGRYAEAIDVHGRVHIKGACASETIIDVSTPNAEDAVVDLTGTGGSTLENLTVTGARVGVWVWATQEPVNIRGVIIDGATVNGLLMTDENAGAIIENLVVKNTQGSDGNLFDGMGIYIASTGDTTFTNTWLFRNQNVAIDVHGIDVHGIKEDIDVHGLTFQGLVIEETLPKTSDQTAGWGLRVATGARVTMTDALLDRSSRQAIDVHGINTELAATRLVVRDTQAQRSDALWGQGLLIGDGAFVMLDDAVFTDNRLAAIDVHGIDGVLEARNIEVRGTKPRATDDVFGVGMLVTNQASARVVNGTFEGNHAMGVWAHGEGVSLTLESTTIENTYAQPADGVGGRGLEIATGAWASLAKLPEWMPKNSWFCPRSIPRNLRATAARSLGMVWW